MNANLSNLPLPSLSPSVNGCRRRHRAGPIELASSAWHRFQQSAAALQTPDVACADTVASVARTLIRQVAAPRRAPCIQLRLRCLAGLRAMANEPHWELDADRRRQIEHILAYAGCANRLIPYAEPVIGGLDDALLVEWAWPTLHAEFVDYLDFRALRSAEATLQKVPVQQLHYRRSDWLQARAALDAAAKRQRNRVFDGSYVAAAPALFRVH